MSELIKHECGIALIRLLKPLEYYQQKYGSWLYGLHKLYLLMEKQHNRGQDGAGVAAVKFDMDPGMPYIFRHRSIEQNAIDDVFRKISKAYRKLEKKDQELMSDVTYVKSHIPFAAELYLGHLRYGTFGGNTLDYVHPVMRQNNWRSRNLVMAGNFNLTNVDEIFSILVDLGQHPKDFSDTVTILENVGHFLDTEVQRKFNQFKAEGYNNREISFLIEENLDVSYILRESSKKWDGGYAIIGMIGHGDAFVMRDPWGIRPAFYYKDEEVAVVASERPVIQTVFNVPYEQVHEIPAGNALIIKKKGDVFLSEVREPKSKKSCSFERIYFSRGSDRDIYRERKALGELLVPSILKAVDYDLDHTVFSYIPNTAETAFYGMIKGIERYMLEETFGSINGRNQMIGKEELTAILYRKPRVEKVAIKDIRLRTFISQDKGRDDLVEHVYDITYGTLEPGVDNLVIIDDSIVRGTTLKKSILRILDRLGPKKIVVVSSSPQIRYPDCYGIDMAKLGDFIAFRAAVRLLQDTSQHKILNEVYRKCKEQQHKPKEEIVNYVKEIYAPFSDEEISAKIAELLKTEGIKAEVRIVYQTVENLHKACPNHTGDWYFTGDYPTPGGNKVVNTSFINFMEGRNQRAY
ncbi:MAG TPA: amidophosphoribosyltransferase [Bacteroidales bacterium]|nr:amidophosphoribosyltransferase [Bacteroidales bacterium]